MQAEIVRLLERIRDRQVIVSTLAAALLESAATRRGKDDGWVVINSVEREPLLALKREAKNGAPGGNRTPDPRLRSGSEESVTDSSQVPPNDT